MPTTITWTTVSGATWTFETLQSGQGATDTEGPVGLVAVSTASVSSTTPERTHQPLVEVRTASDGGRNLRGSRIGANLRLTSHDAQDDRLVIVQDDPTSGVRATTTFTATATSNAVRAVTTLSLADGFAPIQLWAVTSVATGVLVSDNANDLDIWSGANGWSAEHRWNSEPLRAPGLARTDRGARGETSSGSVRRFGQSSMSTGRWLPAGVATHGETGASLAWQIEHNGGWSWEVGETPVHTHTAKVGEDEAIGRPEFDSSRDGVFVALTGPIDGLHHWSVSLDEHSSFTTVPATIAVGASRDDALGELARHRRAHLRPHPASATLPVIFNDYMDTLEGDPTEAKLLPLIDAAAAVGSDIFCIDAGWYDDTAGWWASVGDWIPSTARFPRGLDFVLDHIRGAGMVAGLWVEPEVVGITSQAAVDLPDEAFMWRDGVRLTENGRHFLDLRSPAARAHLDAAIDRLVNDLGVGFFKFDHNCSPGPGTDRGDGSLGAQLLEHQRAFLSWLDALLDRHEGLVIESCASGAMRSDFAMLERLHLQSTSDQQDPLLYPAIAVGALAHILPEQAGNWAYPQATMTDEQIVFTQVTGMAGRIYQAGLIDRMDDRQRGIVAHGIEVHRAMLPAMARSVPRFPTGLPTWDDGWITVVFDADGDQFLLAWRQQWAEPSVEVPLVHLSGAVRAEQLYPAAEVGSSWQVEAVDGGVRLSVDDTAAAARVWRLHS